MRLLYILLVLLILNSCSNNCEECEKKLLDCAQNIPVPVELPKTKKSASEMNSSMITVEVSATNIFILDSQEYEFEALVEAMRNTLDSLGESRVKIAADKNARYESVFKVMAACEKNNWSPILAYRND